jgi:hypothetical protein
MHKAIVLAGWAAALVACGAPAEAHIVCHDGFQVVNGREISTPYCNDNYLAAVARQYGVKATDEAVRNNPSLKDQICRFAGSDIRIKNYCPDDHGNDSSR